MSKPPDIATLAAAVTTATEQYKEAYEQAERASQICSGALNNLNRAQKALDEAMAKVRQEAPFMSGWHQGCRE